MSSATLVLCLLPSVIVRLARADKQSWLVRMSKQFDNRHRSGCEDVPPKAHESQKTRPSNWPLHVVYLMVKHDRWTRKVGSMMLVLYRLCYIKRLNEAQALIPEPERDEETEGSHRPSSVAQLIVQGRTEVPPAPD